VVVSARSDANDVVKEIKAFGGEAIYVKADVSKEEDIANLIKETIKKYGKLDVLINNAAMMSVTPLPLHETNTKDFEEVIKLNLLGTYWGMKYAITEMLKTGGGSIVNISSVSGLIGIPTQGHYVSSKHAVNGLSKSAALEYATKGIRINTICPGSIKTEMMQEVINQGIFSEEFIAAKHPIGRIGKVEEVVNAIVFVASNEASFMTGTIIPVDGGLTTGPAQ